MRTRFFILAAGAALLLAQPAFAHHPSGVGSTGGAGPINTISASPLEQGEVAASIAFEWIKIDPLSNAFLADFGATHGHDVHVHSLSSIMAPAISFGYGITADFTISARLPVVVRTDIKEAAHIHPGGGAPPGARGPSGPARGVRLGVDVGKVRVGVSRSDPDGILATPLTTLRRDLASAEPTDIVALAALEIGRAHV